MGFRQQLHLGRNHFIFDQVEADHGWLCSFFKVTPDCIPNLFAKIVQILTLSEYRVAEGLGGKAALGGLFHGEDDLARVHGQIIPSFFPTLKNRAKNNRGLVAQTAMFLVDVLSSQADPVSQANPPVMPLAGISTGVPPSVTGGFTQEPSRDGGCECSTC